MALKQVLVYYYYLINFLTRIVNVFQNYKMYVFDGEVMFKAYISDRKGFVKEYNHEKLWYILWAMFLNVLGLDRFRVKEKYTDMYLRPGVLNVFTYVENKVLVGGLQNTGIQELRAPKPKAIYVVVNDKYDVSYEYGLFKNALEKVHLSAFEVMEVLVMYKLRFQYRPSGYWHKLVLVEDDTFKEFTFKAETLFSFTHE